MLLAAFIAWQVCGGMLVVSPTRDMMAFSVVRYVSHGSLSGGACSMGWPGGGGGAQADFADASSRKGKETGQDSSSRNRVELCLLEHACSHIPHN